MTQKFLNGFVDNKDLYLIYRDPQGQRMARRHKAEWSSFVKQAEIPPELLRELKASEFVSGVREDGEFYRICWSAPEWRSKAHGREGFFQERSIQTYEADVDPVRRYFSETGDHIQLPRRIYLDIETDSRVPPAIARQGKARVLCWSLADDDLRTVARAVLTDDVDDAERKLLEALWGALEPYDQVCAWFGDLFDFPVVKLRTLKLGAKAKDPRRWLWMDHAEVYERMNKNAAESGAEKSSRALQFVAQETIGEGKDDFDARKTWEAWAAGGAERERMARYCDNDALLLPKIEKKTGYLALNASVCEACRVFPDTDSATPTAFVDGFMLRMGVERGMRFPTRPWAPPDAERKKFAGAWVLEPQVKGIRKNVHVVDFSGMYPSIIQTFNMSPETISNDVLFNGPIPENCCRAPMTRVGFRTDTVGLLSLAVAEMKRLRKFWSKRQAELSAGSAEWWEAARRSAAYKVIVNIFYGIAGSPHSRYSEVRVAESVSTTGVWLIKATIAAAEDRGLWAIYSDTDSAFFESKDGNPISGETIAEFVRWCNVELYPKMVREVGCVENHIELAYEKEFERLVLVSKKRYAAVFRTYKGTASCECDKDSGDPGAIEVRTMTCKDCGKVWGSLPPPRGKPEIRGLEYRRGDAVKIARRLQGVVVDMLMRDRCEDPSVFPPVVESIRDYVLNQPLPVDDVALAQSITKPMREYEKSRKEKTDGSKTADLPHVQVAKILKSRGEQVVEGMRISYVVTDASESPMKVIPAVDYGGECDRYYLWENRIWPATMRLLDAAFPAVLGMNAEELLARDWSRYDKVRPKKERAPKAAPDRNPGSGQIEPGKSRKKAPVAQASLFAPPAPVIPDGPLEVHLGEGSKGKLDAFYQALKEHPGDRAVVMYMKVRGAECVFDLPQKVAVSPELLRAVENAKQGGI